MGRGFSTIPWLMQRISAGILVVLLFIHFWVGHYANLGASITFAGVQMRLQNAIFVSVDSMLLILVVFHGLNGIRNIVLDYPSILPHNRYPLAYPANRRNSNGHFRFLFAVSFYGRQVVMAPISIRCL